TIWDDSLPMFEPGPIVSHALLVHNWVPGHAFRINGPLWSVATEWQIYFFFPFVLLPIWRRFGMGVGLGLALALGYAPLLVARSQSMHAIPWYLFLFAQGMAAAQLNFADPDPEAARRRLRLYGRAAALGWSFCLVVGFAAAPLWFRFKPITDTLVGASTAALLVYATERVRAGQGSGPVVGLFESRPVTALGHASYSLYLTHLPIVALCYFALRPLQLPLAGFLAALAVLGLSASLLFAAAFYWLIERHFVNR
ncbi:MAG TPA: acyltransferase, partial [Polyangiales bacterium]